MTSQSRWTSWCVALALAGCSDAGNHDDEAAEDESSTQGASEDSGTDTGTDTDAPPSVALGEVCPLAERIGAITVLDSGGPLADLTATIYDKPDPWVGPPELANDTCAYHAFAPDTCGSCSAPQVCAFDGTCVDPRLAYTDALLRVDDGDMSVELTPDAISGLFYASVASDAALTFTLEFAGHTIELPAMSFAAPLPDLMRTLGGDDFNPESLDVTWTPREDDTRVSSVIPINHHAAGPTFTNCDVPASSGAFHADGDMLMPLAVITGLEYQGTMVSTTAAVDTPQGCIDVRLGHVVF
jgi:hypothetical protein